MSRLWRRRDVVRSLAAACIAPRFSMTQAPEMLRRPIPSSGRSIAAVGLGTWQTFDVGTGERERAPLRAVLRRFVDLGGEVVDSSPMYGRSEGVVGDLAADLGVASSLFYATKVWTRGRREGIEQMNRSFERMRVQTMDLMQIHNLVDWQTHLDTLRAWKDEGRVRHVGVTHYQTRAFDDLERLIRNERLDFVQLNFSIQTRRAEERLIPLAVDHGTAVLVNRPYEEGAIFRRVRGHDIPGWASEFDCESWGQFFLKYILSAPGVTCVIPATSDPEHLVDNMGAGRGRLPDPAMRRRMVRHLEAL